MGKIKKGLIGVTGSLVLASIIMWGTIENFLSNRLTSNFENKRIKRKLLIEKRKEERDNRLKREILNQFYSIPIKIGKREIKSIAYSPGLSSLAPKKRHQVKLESPEVGDQDYSPIINKAITTNQNREGLLEILLDEGYYFLKSPVLMKSRVVLRGAGPRKTILVTDGPNGSIYMCGEERASSIPIIGGVTKEERTVKIKPKFSLEEGQLVKICFSEKFLKTEKGKKNANKMANAYPYGMALFISQMARIKQVHEDCNLSLDTTVRLTYPAILKPELKVFRPIEYSGLEDLTIEATNRGRSRSNLKINGALNCWIRNCEFSHSLVSHVWVTNSKNLEFSRNYFHHGWGYHGKKSLWGYGLVLADATTDCLVTDNVFRSLRHAMCVEKGANGNVFSYNYSIENNPQQNREDSADFSAHGFFPYMNLVENNYLQFIHSSDNFGRAGPLQTFFRNRILGKGGIVICTRSHFPIVVGNYLEKGGIYLEDSIMGRIIGEEVFNNYLSTNYNYLPKIRVFGFDSTLTCKKIKPKSYAGKMPPSLYLKSKPKFLGDTPWPCFGPDVKEEVKLPAQRRYEEIYSKWKPKTVPNK